jgi:hypothetical protein
MVDALDVWMQLPKGHMIARFDEIAGNQVVIGADKKCWPNDMSGVSLLFASSPNPPLSTSGGYDNRKLACQSPIRHCPKVALAHYEESLNTRKVPFPQRLCFPDLSLAASGPPVLTSMFSLVDGLNGLTRAPSWVQSTT